MYSKEKEVVLRYLKLLMDRRGKNPSQPKMYVKLNGRGLVVVSVEELMHHVERETEVGKIYVEALKRAAKNTNQSLQEFLGV